MCGKLLVGVEVNKGALHLVNKFHKFLTAKTQQATMRGAGFHNATKIHDDYDG